jgi:hypothetical protein
MAYKGQAAAPRRLGDAACHAEGTVGAVAERPHLDVDLHPTPAPAADDVAGRFCRAPSAPPASRSLHRLAAPVLEDARLRVRSLPLDVPAGVEVSSVMAWRDHLFGFGKRTIVRLALAPDGSGLHALGRAAACKVAARSIADDGTLPALLRDEGSEGLRLLRPDGDGGFDEVCALHAGRFDAAWMADTHHVFVNAAAGSELLVLGLRDGVLEPTDSLPLRAWFPVGRAAMLCSTAEQMDLQVATLDRKGRLKTTPIPVDGSVLGVCPAPGGVLVKVRRLERGAAHEALVRCAWGQRGLAQIGEPHRLSGPTSGFAIDARGRVFFVRRSTGKLDALRLGRDGIAPLPLSGPRVPDEAPFVLPDGTLVLTGPVRHDRGEWITALRVDGRRVVPLGKRTRAPGPALDWGGATLLRGAVAVGDRHGRSLHLFDTQR